MTTWDQVLYRGCPLFGSLKCIVKIWNCSFENVLYMEVTSIVSFTWSVHWERFHYTCIQCTCIVQIVHVLYVCWTDFIVNGPIRIDKFDTRGTAKWNKHMNNRMYIPYSQKYMFTHVHVWEINTSRYIPYSSYILWVITFVIFSCFVMFRDNNFSECVTTCMESARLLDFRVLLVHHENHEVYCPQIFGAIQYITCLL